MRKSHSHTPVCCPLPASHFPSGEYTSRVAGGVCGPLPLPGPFGSWRAPWLLFGGLPGGFSSRSVLPVCASITSTLPATATANDRPSGLTASAVGFAPSGNVFSGSSRVVLVA